MPGWAALAAGLALLGWLNLLNTYVMLVTVFFIQVGFAFNATAWTSIVPQVVSGNLTLDPGTSPVLYTGTGNSEQNRYLQLINSPDATSASGLKAGGVRANVTSISQCYENNGLDEQHSFRSGARARLPRSRGTVV